MSEILKERIFIAGSSGMVGSSIKRELLRIGFSKNSTYSITRYKNIQILKILFDS